MSRLSLQFRLMFIALGILTLIGLAIEDKNEIYIICIAAVICTLAAAIFSIRLTTTNKIIVWQQTGIGILAGIAIIPVALLLIAIKTGFHAHPTPDFSSAQIFFLLKRWPFWILGGLLSGFGIGLWRYSRSPSNNTLPS